MDYQFTAAHPFLASLAVVAGIAVIVFCISYVISQVMREKRQPPADVFDAANEELTIRTRLVSERQSRPAFVKESAPRQSQQSQRSSRMASESRASRSSSAPSPDRTTDWDGPLFPGAYSGGGSPTVHHSVHVDSVPCAAVASGWDGGSGGGDSNSCSPTD